MSDIWLFGYGSLIWRPDFQWVERVPGSIEGWARRFWQASPDHRGTPEAPGRVVTLVRAQGRCHGVAYRIASEVWEPIRHALDHRESAGYERNNEPITLIDGRVVEGVVYVAGPHNPNFLGTAPLEHIASQIAASRGPSGANDEYLLRLAEALRELGADDPHVFALEQVLGGRP